jgi:mono/diheme cytochrome c family protein
MRRSRFDLGLAAVLILWSGWMLLPGTSSATLEIRKKAKDLGFPVENCQYCHQDKLPKKGASAPNERGTWLRAEKEKRHAKEVDPAWLKEYPGDKK